MFCSLCYSSTAWWAWGRNAALSHSPEPALPELRKAAFDPVYRPLIRNLLSLPPILREQQQDYFSRGTGIKTGQWEEGGEGNTHRKQKQQPGDTKRHSPLFGSRDALYCSGTWLHSSLRFGEWRWRGDWLESMVITKLAQAKDQALQARQLASQLVLVTLRCGVITCAWLWENAPEKPVSASGDSHTQMTKDELNFLR